MRRASLLTLLFLLVAALQFALPAARPVVADSMQGFTAVRNDAPGLDSTDVEVIKVWLNSAFYEMTRTDMKGWGCVQLQESSDSPGDVFGWVLVEPGREDGDYTVTAFLRIRTSSWRGEEHSIWEGYDYGESYSIFPNAALALADAGADGLTWLMKSHRPCLAKAKVEVKSKFSGSRGEVFSEDLQGDAEVALREDGSFEGTSPLTVSTTMAIPEQNLTMSLTAANPTLQLKGSYSDGKLTITELTATIENLTGSASAQLDDEFCTYTVDYRQGSRADCVDSEGNTSGGSMPALPIQLTLNLRGDNDRTIELADGARLTLDRPVYLPAGWTWEANLTLEYLSEGDNIAKSLAISPN
jgi:hypothetical protein